MDQASYVISTFKGLRALARALGIPVSTVQGWKERGQIPQKWWAAIIEAAEKAGLRLTLDDFTNRLPGATVSPPLGAESEAPGDISAEIGPPIVDEPERELDPETMPTALDTVVAALIKGGLLPVTAETKSPRTFCKEPGKRWRPLPDSEAPPMEARIIRTEWNGAEWVQTFDSHEPVRAGEAA